VWKYWWRTDGINQRPHNIVAVAKTYCELSLLYVQQERTHVIVSNITVSNSVDVVVPYCRSLRPNLSVNFVELHDCSTPLQSRVDVVVIRSSSGTNSTGSLVVIDQLTLTKQLWRWIRHNNNYKVNHKIYL